MAWGRSSTVRPLASAAFLSVLFSLLVPLGGYAVAQQTQGDRLTAADIDPLPGGGKQDARGVCSDGTTLWVVEGEALKLYAYSLANDSPNRNQARDVQLDVSENAKPGGCTTDGTTIWVADDGNDKLFAYAVAGGARVSGKDFGALEDANNRLTGVTNDGSTTWVADLTLKKLFAYRLSDMAYDTDKDLTLHSENVNPVGLWTDGTTMWVADSSTKRFYAYDLSTKQRDAEKEFAATDATNVQGIWSNGSVLWAVNRAPRKETGNKVLAYRMPVTASSDASLLSLTLSGATLSPAFTTDTTAYTTSVGNGVTQTTVTAAPTDTNASVVITPTDADTGTDGHQVALPVGDTTISVTVTAEDGTTTSTYTVTVTRAKSTDASLSALSLSGATLEPAFAADTAAYTASVGNAVAQTKVTATPASGANFTIIPADADGVAAGHQVSLSVGETKVSVTVTAEDETTTSTYTVTVTRAKSADATLSALSLSVATLSPAFAAGETVYTASVRNGVTQTTVTAAPTDTNASVVITPTDADTGTDGHQVALPVGDTTISVKVTAEDGETTQTYTVTVTRAKSTDASLSALSLSEVTLSPTFAADTATYTASVGNGVTQTMVTATKAHTGASVAVTPADADTGTDGHQVALPVGDTAISVKVTAEDGTTTSTYTVTVSRAKSSDASLSTLSLSGVTLTPAFAADTATYTASVENAVAQTKVTATAAEGAAYEVRVGGVLDQDSIVPLAVGSNVITVVVTAQDGKTAQTYTVTVTRAVTETRAKSDDASLSALSLSEVTLTPTFTSGTTAYTASVGNDVTETTVTATKAHTEARVKVTPSDADAGTTGHQVNLAVGDTVVSVTVTAEDGTTMQTYTVTVTRAKSSDASLSALSLSGVTLTPTFASGTTAYTASVGNDVTQTTVSATAAEGAAYEVRVDGVLDQDSIVPLAVGSNVITVVVTAQDGKSTRTYTVTVTRGGSAVASLSTLSLSGVTLEPAFAAGTTAYTASVGNDVTQTKVTATAAEGAAYEVKLDGVVDQDYNVPLAVGSNVITVVVTAQDGRTAQTYTVTVTRGGSEDATLATLAITHGAGVSVSLTPTFSGSHRDYTADVDHDVETITVAAAPTDSNALAEVTPDDADPHREGHQVKLAVGVNVVAVDVTAENSATKTRYTLNVTRREKASALLKDLDISSANLSPAFSPKTLYYKSEVAHDVRIVTVKAAPEDAGASVRVLLDGEWDRDRALALAVGASVVQVEVTAGDGHTKATYTVAVSRAAEQPVPLPTPVRPSDPIPVQRPVATPTPTPLPTVVPSGIGVSHPTVSMEAFQLGENAPEVTFEVWHRGAGRAVLNLSDDAPWLEAWPAYVVSTGPDDRHTVTLVVQTWFLGAGTHTATVYVNVNELAGSSVAVPVTLTIAPRPTATPTPTPSPTPTATPTAIPTAAPSPTASPLPVEAAVAEVKAVDSDVPSPTAALSPEPTPHSPPMPGPNSTPGPTPVPTPSRSALVGIEEPPGPGDGPEALPGGGLGQEDFSGVHRPAELPVARPERVVIMYYSSGTPPEKRRWWLLSVLILADFILPPMRLRDHFRRWGNDL